MGNHDLDAAACGSGPVGDGDIRPKAGVDFPVDSDAPGCVTGDVSGPYTAAARAGPLDHPWASSGKSLLERSRHDCRRRPMQRRLPATRVVAVCEVRCPNAAGLEQDSVAAPDARKDRGPLASRREIVSPRKRFARDSHWVEDVRHAAICSSAM